MSNIDRDRDELDDLLQPTVAPLVRSGKLPWRVDLQFWVAFFGGVFAIGLIAYLNSRHLGSSVRTRRWIAACGVGALLLYGAALWFLPDNWREARIATRVLAVVEYLVLARLQRPDDNRHSMFAAGEYASLWPAGLYATIAALVVHRGIELAVQSYK
ncbi:MAG TPA: hypothetical protein VE010_09965 [Thermoanaerobaculia bacterium]|nr:hypothetical protein [Thermoanaerobaculia bacterium]